MYKNWATWKFFLKVSAQWRYQPMGSIVALDYAAIALPLSFYPKKKQKKIFNKLSFIEQGALKAIRAKQK